MLDDTSLFVFRDADAYRAFNENTFLDEDTKAYLLKVGPLVPFAPLTWLHVMHFFVYTRSTHHCQPLMS